MKYKNVTSKEALKIVEKFGIDIEDEQITFYATDEDCREVWSFETVKERNEFVERNNYLQELSKEELINQVKHWKRMYKDLNEYVERTYRDYV